MKLNTFKTYLGLSNLRFFSTISYNRDLKLYSLMKKSSNQFNTYLMIIILIETLQMLFLFNMLDENGQLKKKVRILSSLANSSEEVLTRNIPAIAEVQKVIVDVNSNTSGFTNFLGTWNNIIISVLILTILYLSTRFVLIPWLYTYFGGLWWWWPSYLTYDAWKDYDPFKYFKSIEVKGDSVVGIPKTGGGTITISNDALTNCPQAVITDDMGRETILKDVSKILTEFIPGKSTETAAQIVERHSLVDSIISSGSIDKVLTNDSEILASSIKGISNVDPRLVEMQALQDAYQAGITFVANSGIT